MNFSGYINLSKDNEIFCLTNKDGINIYETHNFQLLIKLDPLRIGLVGDVYKPKLFWNSQLITFIISETKNIYSKKKITINSNAYSLVLYDLKNYEIIGKITMNNSIEISDFLITKYFIILMIAKKNKALLFKTSNLKFFKSLSNVESGTIVYSDDYSLLKKNSNNSEINEQNNRCIIVYKDYNNKKLLVIMQFNFNEDKTDVLGVKIKNRELDFNSKGLKYIGIISSYLIVSSAIGNKIHIYELLSGKFIYCLILGNFPYEITEIHLDNKKKIISVITNNKYLKLYKLNKLSKQCKCFSHQDENISMDEERGIIDKFIHKIGVGRNDFLCRYKVNYDEYNMKKNMTLIYFDKNSNDCVYTIQINKNVKQLKFDRKVSKDMIVMQEMTLPDYYIYENNINSKSIINENDININLNENQIKNDNIINDINKNDFSDFVIIEKEDIEAEEEKLDNK